MTIQEKIYKIDNAHQDLMQAIETLESMCNTNLLLKNVLALTLDRLENTNKEMENALQLIDDLEEENRDLSIQVEELENDIEQLQETSDREERTTEFYRDCLL